MKPFASSILLWFGLCAILSGCQEPPVPESSLWRGELQLRPGHSLPFLFRWQPQRDSSLVILNGEEEIVLFAQDIQTKGDSLRLELPVFDTYLLVHAQPSGWEGAFFDPSRGSDYQIPFRATPGVDTRFPRRGAAPGDPFPQRWAILFSPGTKGEYPAVGRFESQGQKVTGTFMTETGDYRFLSGYRTPDSLFLSTFDGAHAFLFTAAIRGDTLWGQFASGTSWQEPWLGWVDPDASLRSPDDLTYLKPGYEKLTFAFPDLAGDTVTFPNPEYEGKVVVLQVMGSWCPNCMDETRLLAAWYDQYQSQGLEVVGLAFERWQDPEKAALAVRRMADRLEADYPFLLAALSTSKATAAEKLPMLNQIMSYPTSIWIDRTGQIRRIHTGFNGPGTGQAYEDFVNEYQGLLEQMLAEPDPAGGV